MTQISSDKKNIRSYPHQVERLAFDVNQPYERFRDSYERAVPKLEEQQLDDYLKRRASWKDVVAEADALAPFGFIIYWKSDAGLFFTLAGDSSRCTAYLMGNHTIAERMFRFDPSIMLYAPLRTEIYADSDNRTRFAVDRPTSVFSSFGNPEIAKVGVELDAKLERLLKALDVDVGDALKP